jgi:hypothetical protein
MAFDLKQVDELKCYHFNLQVAEEGGFTFILIPELRMPDGCTPQTVDALLCPFTRDGYPSRLFLSSKVVHKGPGQNWNANGVILFGRQWWAVSWHTHKEDQRLLGMVTAHLQAFK